MEIELEKLYTVKEAADILSVNTVTIKRKCHGGDLVCSNIGTEGRKIYRISGENIFNFLNNK